MSADTEYTAKEVAAHRGRDDAWMVINGEGEYFQGENRNHESTQLTSDV